jgi:hypothetical protein
MEGIEAVAEWLLNPEQTERMLGDLGLAVDGDLQYFEVLVRSSRLDRTSTGTEIIAHRLIKE